MSLCFGCGDQIYDQFILRVSPDLEWHAACLKCTECHRFLDETCTCFVRDGKTYCKCDYLRLFGAKCANCSESFTKDDFVMRARNKIYHVDCFKCMVCSKKLLPGDEFALREDGLFCKADHEILEKNGLHSSTSDISIVNGYHRGLSGSLGQSDINGNSVSPNSNNSNPGNQLQLAANVEQMQSNHRHRDSIRPQVHKQNSEHKPTRVRTVLNEKQLHTLRTCYAANPRPDALMKEQLVEMTGLSPRVIRVWFQNKRCKDKKKSLMMKQMQQQEKDGRQLQNIASMRGVPLVATSPVRHESPVQHPLEVQSYHPPWKSLADYALQSDCDPNTPHFQHLVNQIHGYDVPTRLPLTQDTGSHLISLHGGPTTGPCTPLSYLDHDLHQPHSNLSSHIPGTPSEMSSPCTSD